MLQGAGPKDHWKVPAVATGLPWIALKQAVLKVALREPATYNLRNRQRLIRLLVEEVRLEGSEGTLRIRLRDLGALEVLQSPAHGDGEPRMKPER